MGTAISRMWRWHATLSPMTSRCDFYVSTALHLSHLSHVCLMFVSQMRQVQSVEGVRVRRGWLAKSHFSLPLCTFLCENSSFLNWENIKNPCCLMWFSRVNSARGKYRKYRKFFLYLSYDNYKLVGNMGNVGISREFYRKFYWFYYLISIWCLYLHK